MLCSTVCNPICILPNVTVIVHKKHSLKRAACFSRYLKLLCIA
jgi:hypothetical protein